MSIKTIIKEADKEFDSLWDRFDMDQPHNIKHFLHSQIEKSFKAGQEDILNELKEEHNKFIQGFAYKPKENKTPIGVSQWEYEGKKYGYWDYFVEQLTQRKAKKREKYLKRLS